MCNITYCKDKFGTPEERKGISVVNALLLVPKARKKMTCAFFLNSKLCNLLRGTVK